MDANGMSGFRGMRRRANGCRLDAPERCGSNKLSCSRKALSQMLSTRIVRGDNNAAAVACELGQTLK
ncbi:MAG: hypothetical protein ACLU0O_09955 [Collinsella sp.]